MRYIEVIIKPDGTPVIEGKGFSGPDCIQATKYLEDALGVKTSDQRTQEFYTKQKSKEQLKQKGQ